MELKLSSGRVKDRTHIVEVLKTMPPETIAAIRRHIAGVHLQFTELLDQLIDEAIEERREEEERGKTRE
jgi:hypothetical protein